MSINLGGYSANSLVDVESNTLAAKVSQRPLDWSPQVPFVGGGSYSRKLYQTVVSPGAPAGSVFQFRWTNAALFCAVRRISISQFKFNVSTAQVHSYGVFIARNFTTAGVGGGAFSGQNMHGARRGIHAPVTLADMRVDTGTAISNGTWTLDADAFVSVTYSASASPANIAECEFVDGNINSRIVHLWDAQPGDQPLILAPLEGFDIVASVQGGAVNVGHSVRVEWDEVVSP